jgi:hypothetical protein
MPIVAKTDRGLEPRKWIVHLMQNYDFEGIAH